MEGVWTPCECSGSGTCRRCLEGRKCWRWHFRVSLGIKTEGTPPLSTGGWFLWARSQQAKCACGSLEAGHHGKARSSWREWQAGGDWSQEKGNRSIRCLMTNSVHWCCGLRPLSWQQSTMQLLAYSCPPSSRWGIRKYNKSLEGQDEGQEELAPWLWSRAKDRLDLEKHKINLI